MAFIEKRGPKRWRARYRGPDGREHNKTFPRRIDAERFLAYVESRKTAGEWIDPQLGRVPFRAWVGRWARTIVHLKPKTLEGYEILLNKNILPVFEGYPLARIEPVDVREWVAWMIDRGVSASRVRQAYYLMSSIMRAAVESGHLARNPCMGVRLPKLPNREMLFLSAEEVDRLAGASPEPYGTLIYLLAYGGLRWGEATALRRGRCHLPRSRIEVASLSPR